ncbi:unnamed protein product [Symbiodinium natans]|uniref:Microbial-type PARG catalytic domain-containing protein n=1 Tax=Symbiodinium natans TaxID=878477 RepID=A0A812NDI9_9DINO|nr:unnamed protein product [Symbiodinium natans]
MQIRAPPPQWGGARCQGVVLRQAEGYPEVRIFASPTSGAAVVGTVPSQSSAMELQAVDAFIQVQVGALCGWVGAKNVVRSPAASSRTPWPAQAQQAWAPALPPNPVVAPPLSPCAGAKPLFTFEDSSAYPASPASAASASPSSCSGSAGFNPSWSQASVKVPASLPSYASPSAGRLAGPDYGWIRKANGPGERQLRRSAAEETIAACEAGGYVLDGRQFDLGAVASMCAQTHLVHHAAPARGGGSRARWQRHRPGLLIDVACELTSRHRKVAVVNAASAYHPGGGFLTGGRHALEESLCMRSTFSLSLRKASALARAENVAPPKSCQPATQQGRPWTCHIPELGCLVSPEVEVFRGGTDVGYPFLSQVSKVAVISVAMPNRNPQVRDAPIDAPPDPSSYQALILQKFAAVLASAGRVLGPDGALVIPDVGCGAYGNDPKEVGSLLGEALRQQPGLFAEIHLVGQDGFADAAEGTAKGWC